MYGFQRTMSRHWQYQRNLGLCRFTDNSSSSLYWQKCNKRAENKKRKTLLSNCKNTANTYKSTISQDNKSPNEIKTSTRRRKMKWQFQSYIDKIKWDIWHTKSTSAESKITAMLEKDTVPNWDRMWLLNGQWQITCSSVCITPHGHSLSYLGIALMRW